ncbi:hypothetical protein HU200_065055 [Digitaria exilis]|uniref:Strictosidine synthase conserved region domain-containing protein n=1 Tax=Digitaria exilis TaxID=1010633 RepID=A0A834ZZ24_9POAL|nr:hypothetical protein HU200_065055 [Digitaria exilis]
MPLHCPSTHTAQRKATPRQQTAIQRERASIRSPGNMGAAKCSPATLLPFVFLLLLPPMATCREEMESVYVGKRVLPVRLGRPAFGPESLAFDHRGDGPYTGVSNGRFHGASGDLYFADAYLGLMRVGRRGGLAEAVVTEAGGAPLNFANGVDVDQDTGHVYFTDSSATFQRRRRAAACSATGCAASTDHFADLPGYPDNVRRAGGDYYWVALNKDKPRSVAAVRVRAADGAVVEALRGLGNATLSEVVERPGGALWLGSVDTPYVGLFRSGP